MPRKGRVVECDDQTRRELERLSNSHSTEIRLVRRAKIVLGCIEGKQIKDIASRIPAQLYTY